MKKKLRGKHNHHAIKKTEAIVPNIKHACQTDIPAAFQKLNRSEQKNIHPPKKLPAYRNCEIF
ncbi:MAG: hypothetical protein LBH04_07325 [Tannerellaceae bacterium]|jgi:hypothetical protein|nr:hypothetical protein [Tannerellaceae bacterium]